MISGRALLLPLLLLAAPGLAACGGDDDGPFAERDADQILREAEAATGELSAVRMKGTILDKEGDMVVDLRVDASGDCRGNLRIKGQGSLKLRVVDGVSYFKADDRFWRSQSGGDEAALRFVLDKVGDRWVYDSTDPGGFTDLCDLDTVLDDIDADSMSASAEVVGTREIGAVEVVDVRFSTRKSDKAHAYVATAAPHHVIRLAAPGEAQLSFGAFDKPVAVPKPRGSEAFDLEDLG